MIGFDLNLVFNDNGKVIDYKKAYNTEFKKQVKVYLPMKFCTNTTKMNGLKDKAKLHIAINDTYPSNIEEVLGYKIESETNCYAFDILVLYQKYEEENRIGLAQFELTDCCCSTLFLSQTFRIN